jgi:ATP-binding cassette subfamily F protein uup
MLLSAEKIKKGYSQKVLLDDVSLTVDTGDKIGVIGVNGTGKSTFLKILAQLEEPDSGTVTVYSDARIQYLPQNPVWDEELTVLEHVCSASPELMETGEFEAKRILTKLGITEFDKPVRSLSGGQRKRVAIAGALLAPSEVLLLDEPTNHLDTGMIRWLESYLIRYTGALIMVTHDRYFLERIVNRIVEIDRGHLYGYQANYSKFLELKAQQEDMELAGERKRQSILRRELEWLQRGPRARGTKSKDRIARYEALSEQSGPPEQAKLEIGSLASRLGKKTVELRDISIGFDGNQLIRHFDHVLLRDDRIGIIGKNGCGKSTLLNIISGRLAPDGGSVETGQTVRLGYFSQGSEDMDLDMRVIDYIKEIAGTVETPEGAVTAAQMLEKFMFPPDLQWNTIGRLSGGERRRLYLLGLLMRAPNVLLLDEPTNDLDIRTLTVLEDYLESFSGAVVAVSHDRFFLDRVADTIFDFGSDGVIKKYLGCFSDYCEENPAEPELKAKPEPVVPARSTAARKLKFSFKEQREFETIDAEIAGLEAEIAGISDQMEAASSDYIKLQALTAEKEGLEQTLEDKIDRWAYLNNLAEMIAGQG